MGGHFLHCDLRSRPRRPHKHEDPMPSAVSGIPDVLVLTLGLEISKRRSHLNTLGPIVGVVHILGALGFSSRM